MKKNDIDSYVSVTAALIVIFTAMVSPSLSLVAAILLIISYATYKYRQMDPVSALKPFVFSALLACIAILVFTAIHDIFTEKNNSHYVEYAALLFSTVIALHLFKKTTHKKKKLAQKKR